MQINLHISFFFCNFVGKILKCVIVSYYGKKEKIYGH